MTDDEKAEAVVMGVSGVRETPFVCPHCVDIYDAPLLAEPGKHLFCPTCKWVSPDMVAPGKDEHGPWAEKFWL